MRTEDTPRSLWEFLRGDVVFVKHRRREINGGWGRAGRQECNEGDATKCTQVEL